MRELPARVSVVVLRTELSEVSRTKLEVSRRAEVREDEPRLWRNSGGKTINPESYILERSRTRKKECDRSEEDVLRRGTSSARAIEMREK